METLTAHQELTSELASQLVDQAMTAGATDAEVVLYEGDEYGDELLAGFLYAAWPSEFAQDQ